MSRRKIVSIDLMGHLCLIPDPRQRKVKHPLINILFIAVIASLCGVDDFVGMATFCKAKRTGFSKYLDLSNGIPSHDRINAVFAMLKPEFV